MEMKLMEHERKMKTITTFIKKSGHLKCLRAVTNMVLNLFLEGCIRRNPYIEFKKTEPNPSCAKNIYTYNILLKNEYRIDKNWDYSPLVSLHFQVNTCEDDVIVFIKTNINNFSYFYDRCDMKINMGKLIMYKKFFFIKFYMINTNYFMNEFIHLYRDKIFDYIDKVNCLYKWRYER